MSETLTESPAKKRPKRPLPRALGARLEINGIHEGDLSGRDITVHHGATVMGNVGARSVVIHGRVNGIVQAATIALGKTARIQGELRYETLSIDCGAEVEARLVPGLPAPAKRRVAGRRMI